MVRWVRRKLLSSVSNSDGECTNWKSIREVDWTKLPDDVVIQLFSNLNYRDRGSLSSTCRAFRSLGSSSCLWESLDLRSYKINFVVASSLSSRFKGLKKIQFSGAVAADAIITMEARQLHDISVDGCEDITDGTLSAIAARNEMLEILQLQHEHDDPALVSSDAIKTVAMCCSRLKKLQLSLYDLEINAAAINALARHCGNLVEVAFMNSKSVDQIALGNLSSLQFLSVAGTRYINWHSATEAWSKIPKLVGLDVSRTDITMRSVMQISSSFLNLTVLLALDCPDFEAQVYNVMTYDRKVKLILTIYDDIFAAILSLFPNNAENERKTFSSLPNSKNKDRRLIELVNWLEQVLSHSLLEIAENQQGEHNGFWVKQGIKLLVNLLQSSQIDVQERAARGLRNVYLLDDLKGAIGDLCIPALLDFIFKWPSKNYYSISCAVGILEDLAEDEGSRMKLMFTGGVQAIVMLVRSYKFEGVLQKATDALFNLTGFGDGNINNAAVVREAGAIETLVQHVSSRNFEISLRAAGVLRNLSADDKIGEAIAAAGGVVALISFAQSCFNNIICKFYLEIAAGALWGLSMSEANCVAIGEAGGVQPLLTLLRSEYLQVHKAAVGALWNLAFCPSNALRIMEDGGVADLVNLCHTSPSQMTRLMASLTLLFMFDGRMDDIAAIEPLSEDTSRKGNPERVRKKALMYINDFVLSFSDAQSLATVLVSSTPEALAQVTEVACIPEAGEFECSAAEIERYVAVLQNPSPVLNSCSAFALFQFTMAGGVNTLHNAGLLQNSGAPIALRSAAAAATTPVAAKVYAKLVLRNLENLSWRL